MNAEFEGRVSAFVDKSGVKKSDGITPYTSWLIVVDEEGVQYPNSLVAEYYGEKIVPPIINSVIRVGYHVRASEWNGQFYGKNNIWKIDSLEAASTQQNEPQQEPSSTPDFTAQVDGTVADPKPDLPF